MMPAANNGFGGNVNFPDVGVTAAGVPMVCVNMANNASMTPASLNIKVGFMPALNMGARAPVTFGDERLAPPRMKGVGMYTMGNPTILINSAPAVAMLCPTSGNAMNAPIGAAFIPSVTSTLYSDREALAALPGSTIDRRGLDALLAATESPIENVQSSASGAALTLRIARFVKGLSSQVYGALQRFREMSFEHLVLDLRGNPGGDSHAAIALADDFLSPGALIAQRKDGHGDVDSIRARQRNPYPWLLTIWVDAGTASAAEVFAAALQFHGRALVLGETTAGKRSAQAVVPASKVTNSAAFTPK